MTDAPTSAGRRKFSGTSVLVVVGIISVVMCAIVVVFSQRDVSRAMDERSDVAVEFEEVAQTEAVAQPVADDEAGWWRCALLIENESLDDDVPRRGVAQQEIPFFLWIPQPDDSRPAYLRNALEWIEIMAEFDESVGELKIVFPYFDSQITAIATSKAHYQGEWVKFRPSGESRMSFYASRRMAIGYCARCVFDPTHESRFSVASPPMDVAGSWSMEFADSGIAKGVFQELNHIDGAIQHEGTILTPTGDYRYLSGSVLGQRARFAVFDGAHAFLFVMHEDLERAFGFKPRQQFDGIEKNRDVLLAAIKERREKWQQNRQPYQVDHLTGHFYSGNHWHETFTATRLAPGEDFDLPDPFSEVSLKPGETRLHLPLLDDPKYAGKPVIVKIMGTWCPNCHDATRLLVELYAEHHDDGLEILGLAYEHTDDLARSLRQIARFKERLGATWEIIPAGVSDKKKTAATLPALTDIKAYPTTIFLNRDHTVEAIHSGFSGPATGEAYEQVRAEFARLVKVILGS